MLVINNTLFHYLIICTSFCKLSINTVHVKTLKITQTLSLVVIIHFIFFTTHSNVSVQNFIKFKRQQNKGKVRIKAKHLTTESSSQYQDYLLVVVSELPIVRSAQCQKFFVSGLPAGQ